MKKKHPRSETQLLASSTLVYGLGVAILVVSALLILPEIREPFRLPKLLSSEALALITLALLCWRLLRSEGDRLPRGWYRHPAMLLVAPVLLVATSSLLTSSHLEHVREALFSLWVASAVLVGWSYGLSRGRLRLLHWILPPGIVLAAVAVLQSHGWIEQWSQAEGAARLGVTSLAGSVGDLGSYLVLPCLMAQFVLWRVVLGRSDETAKSGRLTRRRWVMPTALIAVTICTYGLFLSQTLTAILALGIGSAVFWFLLVERRTALLALGLVVAVVVLGTLLVAPLSQRVERVWVAGRTNGINAVLSGRLDGWRAGVWMLSQEPLTGVGHGAYVTRFADAKLALVEDGVPMFQAHHNPIFSNAHNEFIELAAELGFLGIAVALWVPLLLLRRGVAKYRLSASPSQRIERGEASLAIAALSAILVLCLGYFPLRIALTGYPIVLVAAWICSDEFLARASELEGAAP